MAESAHLVHFSLMADVNTALVEQTFRGARFLHALGVELVGFGEGWCETKLRLRPDHQQQHGFVHAGVVMTMADHTCGGAGATTVPEGKDLITVETKVSFLRPGTGTELFCRGRVLRSGKTMIFTEAEVTADRNGERVLVGKASSTLTITPLR